MLTENQRTLLATLGSYVDAPSARQLADRLERPSARTSYWSYDRTYSMLRRLRKRGLVSRDSRRPARWTLTDAGREAIA